VLSLKPSRQLYLLLALAAIAILLLVTRPEQDPELREAVSPRVQVEAVTLHDLRPQATVSGRLEPARKAALHFELSGQVDARPVEPGQAVQQGELLLALNSGDFVDAVAEAGLFFYDGTAADLARKLKLLAVRVEKGGLWPTTVTAALLTDRFKWQSLARQYDDALEQIRRHCCR